MNLSNLRPGRRQTIHRSVVSGQQGGLFALWVGALLLFLGGCFSDSGSNPVIGDSSGIQQPDQPQAGSQQTLSADDSGGTLVFAFPDEGVTLTLDIPPGALDVATAVTVDLMDDISAVPGLVTAAVFDIGPDGLLFKVPVELSIAYDSSLISGLGEDELRIHKASGADWLPLLGSVDSANHIATATIDSLSVYGLKTIPVEGGSNTGEPEASLAWVQANVFGGVCSQCHIGAGAPMGVDWSTEAATCSNVGRASSEMPSMLEISSGNPAASYVIWKVEGAGPNGEVIVGDQMPAFNPPLSAEAIQNMKDWIASGVVGCDTQGGGDPGAGDPGAGDPGAGDPGAGGDPGADTWAAIQADILQSRCVMCHNNSPSAPMGLSWEADQFDTVVTNARMSGEISGMKIIEPGNSAASYMVWKINGQGPAGEAIIGSRMPASGPPFLAQADIDRITAWIDAGASNTGTPGGGDPGGDPGGGDPGGDPGGGDPGGAGPDTWTTIQTDILQARCVLCHNNTPSAPMGLSWEADQFDAVVTNARMSGEVPSMKIIEPGNSAASYMVWKINGQGPGGEAIVDSRMPATGPPFLDQADIDRITVWIDAGAPGTGAGDPGGDPGGGDPGGDPGGGDPGGGGTPSTIVPTWYGVQANILGQFCTLCHSGTNPPMGLSWEVDQYDNVVTSRRLSSEIASMAIVEPGDPASSYMFWKISGQGPAGEAISGVRMPATGIPLDQPLIDVIEQWILDGAPLGVPDDADAGGPAEPAFPVGSWMYVWSESLQVCTLCHSLTPSSDRCGSEFECPPKGVVLTADNYLGIVDDSIVEPNDPDGSKLWERVTEDDADKRMPFGLDPLSTRQLQIIRDWIMDGAPFCPANATCP